MVFTVVIDPSRPIPIYAPVRGSLGQLVGDICIGQDEHGNFVPLHFRARLEFQGFFAKRRRFGRTAVFYNDEGVQTAWVIVEERTTGHSPDTP